MTIGLPSLLVLFALLYGVFSEVRVKHLAGPATEFSSFQPLHPSNDPDVQHSASYKVHLSPHQHKKGVLQREIALVIDSKIEFRMFFFSPHSHVISLQLMDPVGSLVSLVSIHTFIPIGEVHVPGSAYIIKHPMPGVYKLSLITNRLDKSMYDVLTANSNEDAYIVVWNENALAMYTTLNTYSHVTGNKIGLITYVADELAATLALTNSDVMANMDVVLPDGNEIELPMRDDGLNNDGKAGDGLYGRLITATMPGLYVFSASINGTTVEGLDYYRTTHKVIQVVDSTLTFTGSAAANLHTSELELDVNVVAPAGQKYYVYAEVWVRGKSNEDTAVAWIGGMTTVQGSAAQLYVRLVLHLNWVALLDVDIESIILRNVAAKDPGVFVAIASADEIHVKVERTILRELNNLKPEYVDRQMHLEMRRGKLPARSTQGSAEQASVVLVHGYCAPHNSFEINPPGTWTNGRFYANFSSSMLNDQFALSIKSFAGDTPYSCVGHSQGGIAILHLHNFYFSGMDYVEDGRVLQSIGTPYQGCSAAGDAANLGKLFGVMCGANPDLTSDGAKLWLQTITTTSREAMNYYSTTYEQGKLFGDYCNLVMNAILKQPNDGTTELQYSTLDGGVFQGNKQKWCHIGGMKYEAQCQDLTRNAEMNMMAARRVVQQ